MEAQKNKDLAEQTFKNFLGVESELDLSPELQMMKTENIELNSAVSEGLQKRIELELSEIGVDVSKVSLRYEKGNFLPTIGLSAEYNYFGQDAGNIESDDWGSAYQVGIGFTMPLFTGLSNTAKKTKARHTLKQAKLDHQNLQELIETDITNTYLQWEADVQKTDVQKQNVALAEKGLEIANARYENQVSNQLEVIDAQLQLKMAKLSYINAEYSAKISYKKLLKAMGRKL
jgi:OMF family outer membrane factor